MINERVLSMLSNAGLTQGFWTEAMVTVVHLINRSPNSMLDGGVPEEAWTGKKPSYDHLHVFGYEAYVHVPREKCSKLEPKSRKCIFMGYGESGKMGYRLWDLEDGIQKLGKLFAIAMLFSMKRRCINSLEKWKQGKYHSRISCHQLSCQEGQMLSHKVCKEKALAMTILVDKRKGLLVHKCRAKWCQVVLRRSTCVSHPPERFVPG